MKAFLSLKLFHCNHFWLLALIQTFLLLFFWFGFIDSSASFSAEGKKSEDVKTFKATKN